MGDISPLEAGKAVVDAIRKKLDTLTADLTRLKKAEEMGKSLHGLASGTPSNAQVADGDAAKTPKLSKTVFQLMKKGETFIDVKNSADPKKRFKDVGFAGVVPGDKPEKKVSAEGSGGEIVKKAGEDMSAAKPASQKPPMPAMPAPKGAAGGQAPKAPKAPGAQMTVKKEVGVFAKLTKKVK
jgi:hypothetical protein